MITLTKFKKLLGHAGSELSDEETELIRMQMYQIADMAFDFWKKKRLDDEKRWVEVLVEVRWVEV